MSLRSREVQAIVSDLMEFCRIRSVGGTAAEEAAQQWVADRFRQWGWQVQTWLDTGEDFAGLPPMEVTRDVLRGVIARPSAHPGGGRLLLGHTDVVPAADWSVRDAGDRIHGRGSVDMKGGLVVAMHAARAAAEAGRSDVQVCAVSAEEDGGAGAAAALRRGLRADECVIVEPTGLGIVPMNAGSLTFVLRARGRSAHAAMRWDGRSALDVVPAVLARLAGLERERNADPPAIMRQWPIPYPISVGTIHGGDWPSTVMDEVVLGGRLGVAPGEPLEAAREALHAAVGDLGIEVSWQGGVFAPAQLPGDDPLIGSLAGAHRSVRGEDPPVHGVTYGSDLRLLLGGGIPTVLYGPGDVAVAHSESESVAVDELQACYDVLLAWLSSPPRPAGCGCLP